MRQNQKMIRGRNIIRLLLNTNIIIYSEIDNVYKENISDLFNIIDNTTEMVNFIHR